MKTILAILTATYRALRAARARDMDAVKRIVASI
jgi:hypothetical protein